jgi:periplasmic protein CpxP/Spy
MSSFTHRLSTSAPLARSVAIAALLSATMLAGVPIAARAETPVPPQSQAGPAATEAKGETVEQRITSLHTALNLSPAQDSKWNAVAQSMRENATAMDKLVAANRVTAPQSMTALDDLKTYQKVAQAHVDGLKNLISSFGTLYDSMSDAQKKNADQVFSNFGHKAAGSHGQQG